MDEIKIYSLASSTGSTQKSTTSTRETTREAQTTTDDFYTTTTTTTRSSTSVSTTIENYPLIYICDFDANDNCGGTLFANNSGFSHAFSANIQSQAIVSTTITDITSISI